MKQEFKDIEGCRVTIEMDCVVSYFENKADVGTRECVSVYLSTNCEATLDMGYKEFDEQVKINDQDIAQWRQN